MSINQLGEKITMELKKIIHGQDDIIAQVMVCLFARGHALIEGVPGLAKTLLAKALARAAHGSFKRVQFTPDLMPTDILGVNVFNTQTASFNFKQGPIFANILLADEINRTPPKTQSALLQGMEERFVTVDGVDYPLPAPFFVIATQNPIEYEGTYPLPETQLDRFLMKITMTYPCMEHEKEILRMHNKGTDLHDLSLSGIEPVVEPQDILKCADEIKNITVENSMYDYIAAIVKSTREAPQLLLGASPRASVAMLMCGKVNAALCGRSYLIPDDIKMMTKPVLRHRLILRPEAELERISTDYLIESLVSAVPVPR